MTRNDVIAMFDVSRETADKLDFYASELLRWQSVKNLIGSSTLDDLWQRHIADSLQLVDLAPDALFWLDLGSGAGLPGLIVAIRAEAIGCHVTLVEANSRKCSFLRETARKLSLPVTVCHGRIEKVVPQLTHRFDVVTARALAPLSQLLDWSYPLLKTGTLGLFPKGADCSLELTESSKSWRFDLEVVPSRTDSRGRILKITSVSKVSSS